MNRVHEPRGWCGKVLRRWFALTVIGTVAVALVVRWEAGHAGPETVFAVSQETAELVSIALPVQVNDRVEAWMDRFQGDQRPMFESYLAREGLYGSMIREKLRSRAMPEELIYLALIESGFSPVARSRVAASGMWQFMGPTAQQYGLTVNQYVDERRDPLKATDAALDYLEALHARFGSWYLAAAAYNAGPTRVARILRRHTGDRAVDGDLYWEIIDQLPRETRSYVPKILAAAVLARNPEHFGIDVERRAALEFQQVFVPGGTSLRRVAASLDVSEAILRELNPHLVTGRTPPEMAYPVRVPPGSAARVVAGLSPRRASRLVD